MFLHEYLDRKKLDSYVAKGIVTCKPHPTLPLNILCYGRKAVYDNIWDDVTCRTRGLIYDANTELIIARPFEKFFNYETEGRKETYGRNVESVEKEFGPPVIQEKVNGSLGIFWKYGIHWGVSSKGSFQSDHAKFATKWLEDHVEEYGKLVFPEGYTPVFEIICQEVQEHVIKYPQDGLALLALVNKETGEELSQHELTHYSLRNGIHKPRVFWRNLDYALSQDSSDFEGYVATYNRPGTTPLKLKIKFLTYLENRKKFYAELEAKKLQQLIGTQEPLYKEIFEKVSSIVIEALEVCTTRKEFAQFFLEGERKQYASICWALVDERDYKTEIWKMIGRAN